MAAGRAKRDANSRNPNATLTTRTAALWPGKSPRADMRPTTAQTTAWRAERPAAARIEGGPALNARMVRTAYQANSRQQRPRQALPGRARRGTWEAGPPHASVLSLEDRWESYQRLTRRGSDAAAYTRRGDAWRLLMWRLR